MKVGERVDAIAAGHRGIDVKTMLRDAGYVVPQTSMANLPELPEPVRAQIAAVKEAQKAYALGGKTKVFVCKACGSRCSAQSRIEEATGQEFFACGSCDTVVEVL